MNAEASAPIDLKTSEAGSRQWVHLVPAGTFKGHDGRGPWHVREPQVLIKASREAAHGRPIPVDYDHQIDLAAERGGMAPAAGWISDFDARSDGIWGEVEWTPRAKKAIDAKEYRFISPVFTCDERGNLTKLLQAALTNTPNLRELAALNSTSLNHLMDTLIEILAIPVDSKADAIIKAVRDLATSKHSADPTKFVPIELFQQAVGEAAKAQAGLNKNAAESVVDRAIEDRKILPFMREWSVNLCMVNKAAFDDFVTGAGAGIHAFTRTLSTPMPAETWHNGNALNSISDTENHIAKTLGLTPEDVQKYGARRK